MMSCLEAPMLHYLSLLPCSLLLALRLPWPTLSPIVCIALLELSIFPSNAPSWPSTLWHGPSCKYLITPTNNIVFFHLPVNIIVFCFFRDHDGILLHLPSGGSPAWNWSLALRIGIGRHLAPQSLSTIHPNCSSRRNILSPEQTMNEDKWLLLWVFQLLFFKRVLQHNIKHGTWFLAIKYTLVNSNTLGYIMLDYASFHF